MKKIKLYSPFYLKISVFIFITASFFLVFNSKQIVAQQNFTPIKDGDIVVIKKETNYEQLLKLQESSTLPLGAKINGTFEANTVTKKEGLMGKRLDGTSMYEVDVKIRSNLHSYISINANLSNQTTLIDQQSSGYETRNPQERIDNNSNNESNAYFKELFLEYDPIPCTVTRFGKQFVNIADQKGMIYQGYPNALTQKCKIGTWDYYIGAAKLGTNYSDSLYWLQLDYPVYESGVIIKNLWNPKGRQQNSLNVEIFRVDYNGNNVPLANYGGWANENSTYHFNYNDQKVYFDNNKTKYAGLLVKWNYYNLLLDFNTITFSGTRKYHTSNIDATTDPYLGSNNVAGQLAQVDLTYQFQKDWKSKLVLFSSTGDDLANSNKQPWEKQSKSYLEIQKGYYGDAFIYFNGKKGIGEGHSIGNLTYVSTAISYKAVSKSMGLDLVLYHFQKSNPIYNSSGVEVSQIGNEIDLIWDIKLDKNLDLALFISAFQPNTAYSINDNITPLEKESDFSKFGGNLSYNF